MLLRRTETQAIRLKVLTHGLATLLIAILAAFGGIADVTAGDTPEVAIEWKIPGEGVDLARNDLHLTESHISADPTSVNDTKGLPLLYIVTGAFALPQLAKAIVDVYKDWKYGKVIITQDSAGKVLITHDPQSPGGTIVFIDAKGNAVFEKEGPALGAETLLDLLTNAIAKKS